MNESPLRSLVAARVAQLLAILVLALPLACAGVRTHATQFEEDAIVELFRRPTPPVPRIPGKVASEHRHASSVPAMRLTASDGTGLALRRVQVRGWIDDPVSLTELHLTFENPHDQVLDGTFELLLPRGAEVSRFSLMVDGAWVESEVVEREQARQVYQAHKHVRRDPALLEHERGRRFSGRIFPIAPRERKQIIISYTSIHDQIGSVFRVPLAGLPRVDELDVQVVRRRPGAADEMLELHGEHQAPSEDFTVLLDGPSSLGLASDTQALLRLVPVPVGAVAPHERPKGLTILVDTSASMATVAKASEDVLVALLAALEAGGLGDVPLELLAFDQTRSVVHAGTVADVDARALEELSGRARLGASDLAAAIDAVATSSDRVILIGDGEISAGADTRFELLAALERAHDRGVQRLDAVTMGHNADLELLAWLVVEPPFQAGTVFDASRTTPQEWVDDLLAPPLGPVDIAVAGAKQVWPQTFEVLRPGQAVVVQASFARTAPAKVDVKVSGAVSGGGAIELRKGNDPLIARSIALLRAKALMAEIEADPRNAASKRELIEIATKHRILTDYTAMLALESEQAYASFGIQRGEAHGVTLGMDEAKQMPVGNSASREFTEVVDLSPTTSHSAAGISFAGTTGAESRYVVDHRLHRRARWSARAQSRRIGPRGDRSPEPIRAFEQQFDEGLQTCARHAAALNEYPERVRLDLSLGFDADARVVEAHVLAASDLPPPLIDCVRYQLHQLAGDDFDTRQRDQGPTFESQRSYVFEYSQGGGSAPEGWRSAEVIEHAASLAFQRESGTVGWAKFIDEDIAAGLVAEALDVAWIWQQARPVDVLPYVSLGRALAAAGQHDEAARAYGSLIDIQPMRAETRRFAGALLESVGTNAALELAIDSYHKARALRPDHPSGYQALALALARHGDHQAAVDVLVDALGRTYAEGRFGDVVELMRRDLATLSAAAILAEPDSRSDVLTQLVDSMVVPEATPRDWITLTWETDASHLGLHIDDESDLQLSQAVTSGFGPQGFEWTEGEDMRPSVQAHELGPEGMAMGCLRRVTFNGNQLEFDTRPFVIWPGQQRVSFHKFERD